MVVAGVRYLKLGAATLLNTYHLGRMAATSSRPSSDMAKFREIYKKSKHVVVLTGELLVMPGY